ncbi:MAG: DUF4328 domain-containing protein [Flavobacteriales bacterium]
MLNEEIIDQHGRENQMSIFDNSSRSKYALIAFGIYAAITSIYLLSSYMQLNILEDFQNGVYVSNDEAELNDQRHAIITYLNIIGQIMTAIFFLMWFKKGYENINTVGIDSTNYSVWSSVWSWIVPILSLFRPVQIMTEISEKTQSTIQHFDPEYKLKSYKSLIGIWWATFIITHIMDRVFDSTSNNMNDTINGYITMTENEIISAAVTIPEIAIVMLLIYRISKTENLAKEKVLENGGYLVS